MSDPQVRAFVAAALELLRVDIADAQHAARGNQALKARGGAHGPTNWRLIASPAALDALRVLKAWAPEEAAHLIANSETMEEIR